MDAAGAKQVAEMEGRWHHADAMPEEPTHVRLRLGPQGRIVIPAHFRRALDLDVGDALVASVQDGRLVLEPKDAALASLRALFAAASGEGDPVAELIDQRRAEARREEADAGSDPAAASLRTDGS
jgi:AbrB family looped-hinge helix DNA binding protein